MSLSSIPSVRPHMQSTKPSPVAIASPASIALPMEKSSAFAQALAFLRSMGVRDSLVMAVAMGLAGVLDYAVNVLTGRWLVPTEYGVFIAVAAVMQVLAQLTNAIRNVVAFYTSELSLHRESSQSLNAFVQRAW